MIEEKVNQWVQQAFERGARLFYEAATDRSVCDSFLGRCARPEALAPDGCGGVQMWRGGSITETAAK